MEMATGKFFMRELKGGDEGQAIESPASDREHEYGQSGLPLSGVAGGGRDHPQKRKVIC
jgi:hypothetical protein